MMKADAIVIDSLSKEPLFVCIWIAFVFPGGALRYHMLCLSSWTQLVARCLTHGGLPRTTANAFDESVPVTKMERKGHASGTLLRYYLLEMN